MQFWFLASSLSSVLKFGGTVTALVGLGIFGFHFIRENGRSARKGQNTVPSRAWRGKGAIKGLRLLTYGAVAIAASIAVSFLLPSASGV